MVEMGESSKSISILLPEEKKTADSTDRYELFLSFLSPNCCHWVSRTRIDRCSLEGDRAFKTCWYLLVEYWNGRMRTLAFNWGWGTRENRTLSPTGLEEASGSGR